MASATACRLALVERSSRLAAPRVAIGCRPERHGAEPPFVPGGQWRIRDRSTFDLLRDGGTRSRCGAVSVVYADDRGDRARVAFGVSRRVGNAVMRNRIRRVLRSELDRVEIPAGAYLVSVSSEAAAVPAVELRSQLRDALAAVTARTARRSRQ